MRPQRNPFRFLRPVPPGEFVGRWSLVEDIAYDLTMEQGDSHACIGGRRFGKSSVLAALHHQLRRLEPDEGDHPVLPLYIDFKRSFPSVEAFWGYVWHQVCRRIDANVRRPPSDSSPVKVPLDEDWLADLSLDRSSGLSYSQFEEAMDEILAQLYEVEGPSRIVLLLDEVDDVLREPWCARLFRQLRALVYAGDLADCARLVLAGSRQFLKEVSEQGSPLWNILALHYLQVFDRASTYELMTPAQGLSETLQEEVWRQSGGHPFLAQYLLHHLWRIGISEATEATLDRIVNRFLHEELAHLQGWARAIGPAGLCAYEPFVDKPSWLEEEELIAACAEPPGAVKDGLVALSYHGFVLHDGGWERYHRTGEMFRQWYLSTQGGQGEQAHREPSIAVTRQLLETAFTVQTLPRFCRDHPQFRPVIREFARDHGLSDMVEVVIAYCQECTLLEEFLLELAEDKAYKKTYERFRTRLWSEDE